MHPVLYFPRCILFLSGLLFIQNSFAQQGPRGQRGSVVEMQAAIMDTLFSILDLTEEQLPAVHAILQARTDSLMTFRPESGRGRGQFHAIRAKRQAIDQETETALAALLTPEQMTSYRTFMDHQSKARRQQMRRWNQPDLP